MKVISHRFPLATSLLLLFAAMAHAETTIYVNEHHEVRDHDEPIKYVFNGGTRIARITGSLAPNTRIQRLRLTAGWNLCSVAVGGLPLPRRLTGQGTDFVTAAYRWGAVLRRWITVQTNESLAAGTVLWLRSTTNTILTLQGEYPEPANQIVRIGGSFHSSAGMNPLRLPSSSTDDDQALGQASFDAARQRWNSHQPSVPWIESGHPAFIGPGQAVFIQTDTPTELEVPDLASRVRYYHQDHLGSSSIVTDANGQRISETAFYPFGESRHEVEDIEESYQFAQKERDLESGLDYLEARYLNAGLSRFASVDPKYLKPDSFSDSDLGSFLERPQELNLYAYAHNNPIHYHDPTGLDAKAALSTGNDVAGFMAGATEEAALWQSRTTPNFDLISGRTT